ncbi:MAG: hypothetical protein AAGI66_06235 [Cyanobacteria bacterium P01_H01_bin.74]
MDNIHAEPLDACVYQLIDKLQSYHQGVQVAAIAFLFLEMMEHLGFRFPEMAQIVQNIRSRSHWQSIPALRGAHLYITNSFKQ